MKDNSDVPMQYRSKQERWAGGKGSRRRPVDQKKFAEGWERAFGNKEEDKDDKTGD